MTIPRLIEAARNLLAQSEPFALTHLESELDAALRDIPPDCADNMVMVPRVLVEEAAHYLEHFGPLETSVRNRLLALLPPPSPTQSPGGEEV